MNSFLRAFIINLLILNCIHIHAQEKEIPRAFNSVSHHLIQNQRIYKGGTSNLNLPFFDDFSSDVWNWENQNVYVNTHFPINPPSIGVATFDGLNANGYPYDFEDPYAYGPADTLTSLGFNLSSFNSNSNVFLSFFYEAGGLGNAPEIEDSLILEFYSPFGAGQWSRIWSSNGEESTSNFNQIFIGISDPIYLLDGFKFRFVNYATLSGEYDLWHLDYVSIDSNVDTTNVVFDEVSQQFNYHTLLNEYSAMPWSHFKTNPASFMATSFPAMQRNLGNDENIVTGFSITNFLNNVQTFNAVDLNTALNANSSFTRNLNLNGYVYPTTPEPASGFVDFTIKTFINPTDAHLENDTAEFTQHFHNYYAYDDGSSERAYAVSASGANVAMKFRSEIADTLLGIYVHWIPFGFDVSNQTFLLRAWADGGNEPGVEIGENYTYQYPHYWETGYHTWTYYAYDTPQAVNGNFYVGWVQSGETELPVGLDKNTDFNPTKLHYNLGFGTNWEASGIQGTVMIRPVLKSGLENWTATDELVQVNDIQTFPNPVISEFTIRGLSAGENTRLNLMNSEGRIVQNLQSNGAPSYQINMENQASGLYFLQIQSENGSYKTIKVVKL
jgi:hypothetical protein